MNHKTTRPSGSMRSPAAAASASLGSLALLLAVGQAQAASDIIEVRLDARTFTNLFQLRAFAEPICPISVLCAAGECLVDAFDYGVPRVIPVTREVEVPGAAGPVRVQATLPQVVLPFEAGFKDARCVADPACGDFAWSEIHAYDLAFDVTAEGTQVCLSLTGFGAGDAPPRALSDAMTAAFGHLCADLPSGNALDLLADGDRLDAAAITVDATGARLAVRYHLDTGRAGEGAELADFLTGGRAPDDGRPFSTFIDAGLFNRAAEKSHSEGLLAGGISPAGAPIGRFSSDASDAARETSVGQAMVPAGNCTVPGSGQAEAGIQSAGPALHLEGVASASLGGFDERTCGANPATVQAAFAASVQAAHPLFASRLQALGGLSDDGSAVATGCAPVASHAGLVCDLLPEGGEVYFAGDARPLLAFLPTGIAFSDEGALFSGELNLTGPDLARVEATLVSPAFTTGGACGAQVQDYRGTLDLRGQGQSCAVTVANDPLGVFTLTQLGRTGAFTDQYTVGLSADTALRARYFAAPYPLRVTAVTTAGARSFEGPSVSPSNGGAEENAERIVSAISCLLSGPPPHPGAGEYRPSYMTNAPHTLRLNLTNNAGKVSKPYAGLHQSMLSTPAVPVNGRNGRFTLTGATFTLRGRIYSRLNNGTALDVPVSVTFVADGTGTTNGDGERLVTLRPRQSLTFNLAAGDLPRGYRSGTVPITLAPAQVRFIANPVR